MFEQILAKHANDANPAVTFTVRGDGPTTVPKPAIDGDQAVIPYNTEVTLPRAYFEVVRDAGYDVELIETDATGDNSPPAAPEAPVDTLGGGSTASADGGGTAPADSGAGAAPVFDADKVIEGNVGDVTARLGALSDEQLLAVKAAEDDREKPRVGVTSAIEGEIANRKAAASAAEQQGAGA